MRMWEGSGRLTGHAAPSLTSSVFALGTDNIRAHVYTRALACPFGVLAALAYGTRGSAQVYTHALAWPLGVHIVVLAAPALGIGSPAWVYTHSNAWPCFLALLWPLQVAQLAHAHTPRPAVLTKWPTTTPSRALRPIPSVVVI